MKRTAVFAVLLAAARAIVAADPAAIAREAQQAGDYQRAIRAWSELLTQQPDNPEVLSNLGVALYLEGKDDAAALEVLRRALAFNSAAVPPNLFLGMCLTRMGQPQDALPYLQRAYQRDRFSPLPSLALAQASVSLRRFDDANRFYYETTRRAPEMADGWYGLGITYRTLLKRTPGHGSLPLPVAVTASRAEFERLRAALTRSPESSDIRSELMAVTQVLTLKALTKAVQLDPASEKAHLLLAEVHRDRGNLVEAVREYETAIRIRPDAAPAHLGLAAALWKTGETESVETPLNRALLLAPDDPEANGILADLRVRSGNYTAAKQAAVKALQGNPELFHVRAVLAKVFLAEGKPDLAVNELRMIADQDETGSWHYLLHRALTQLGRKAEAEAALSRFTQIRKRTKQSGSSVLPEP